MPAWITPLFAPVCPPATAEARSSTTALEPGCRRISSRVTAKPRMPAPTTAKSHSPGGSTKSAGLLLGHPCGEHLEVGVDHQAHHVLEGGARDPAELVARLRRVADEMLDLGGPQEAGVEADVLLGIEDRVLEGDPHELANRMGGAGGDHEVIRLVLL